MRFFSFILFLFIQSQGLWALDARHSHLIETLKKQGIRDQKVLQVIADVQRHKFVPEDLRSEAYENYPLPIGLKQTISQPYIVAYMTESLQLKPTDRVLEIGTGSGYQAAILSRLVKEVYSIEIIEELGLSAKKLLTDLGYHNVHIRIGDGFQGWSEAAPFDAIIITAAAKKLPEPLINQLREGGQMILPLGTKSQNLILLSKTKDGIKQESLLPVRFVPMTGEVQEN